MSWTFSGPLWATVVASGGSKSSTIEGLGFFKPQWPSLWGALGAPLGDLGTLWGHFGVTWDHCGSRLGDLGTFQGHFGGLIVTEYRFHKHQPKVLERCSKAHILEHSAD